MKIALSWLKEYCDWDWSVEELSERLTMSGTEVIGLEETGLSEEKIITAKVLSFQKHPNADRLRLCQVYDGTETRQIVCGASNFQEGDIVPLALPGAKMPEGFTIKKSKLRGELSEGMMCSGPELGLSQDDSGLLILDAGIEPGRPLKDLYQNETVLEVEVTPNRPDLLSYLGVARELKALGAGGTAFELPKPEACKGSGAWEAQVKDKKACPRYTAILIEGVKVGPSPEEMQRKLKAIGLRPVNNIVDITNYVLYETGQPLHAFDADKLDGEKIFVRKAAEGEKFSALNDKIYSLKSKDLVIADNKGVIALAGVMGGKESSVTEGTTRVLLESACFDPLLVRETSRRLQLISDSSYRFERGVDPVGVDLARFRAATLIEELAGGKAVGSGVESASFVFKPSVISVRPERVKKVLGFEVKEDRVKQVLSALGIMPVGGTNWEVPSYRGDLVREVDVIEEIARMEDYEEIPSKARAGVSRLGTADASYDRENRIRHFLADIGYHEIQTSSFVRIEEKQEHTLTVLNPLNEDLTDLRSSLLESALPVIRTNLAREARNLKCFEIGKSYGKRDGKYYEEKHVLIMAVGKESPMYWAEEPRDYDYFSLKGVVEALAREVPGVRIPEEMGLLPPAMVKKAGVKAPVYAAELILEEIKEQTSPLFVPLTVYPPVTRDLAFTVSRTVKQQEVLEAVRGAGVKALESVECFDVFQDDSGEKLDAGKKSLAYTLTYRSTEKTLQEKDVAQWEAKIVASVKERVNGELRE